MESFSFPQHRLLSPGLNRLNIVGSYVLRPFGHPVGMLFRVVGNFLAKFETGGQTSSYVQTFANVRNIVGHWEWLRPFARGFSLNRRKKYSGNGGGGGEGGEGLIFPSEIDINRKT